MQIYPFKSFLLYYLQNTAVLLIAFGIGLIEALPPSSHERSSLIQEQAQDDFRHHQDVLRNQNFGGPKVNAGFNQDGSLSVTFDNNDKNYRDRGYGYEKAYAYSRETAFFDFLADKPSLDAKEIVEKYGNDGNQKEEDLLGSISH